MAFDGAFLHQIKKEIEENILGSKVEKIYQPAKDELIFLFRGKNGNVKLLLSAQANTPRVHFTKESPENPMTPPMLCMLFRKRLESGKLIEVRQPDLERVLFFDFACVNELGDQVVNTLAVEIMGRYSNIILIDESGKIVDAVKRVSTDMSSERLVLPSLAYQMPPMQDKMSLLASSADEVIEAVCGEKPSYLNKALLSVLQGVSPIICRELQHISCGCDVANTELTSAQKNELKKQLENLKQSIEGKGSAVMLSDEQDKPFDFSFIPITQYGNGANVTKFETFSEMMDSFYAKRDQMARMQAKSHDILQLLTNHSEKLARKIGIQQAELEACAKREELRVKADLLNANLYRLEKGMEFAELENFYEEGMPTVKIELDLSMTPSQNAQKYYKEYRRAQTAEKMLSEQINQAEKELKYLETVFDALSRAQNERELAEIRQELAEQGYVRKTADKKQNKQPALLGPMKFISSDGFSILVGRNNRENDHLTLKQANNNDVWLHVKNIPGSHVIIETMGQEVTNEALFEAAQIAAYHSKASTSAGVPVDYTQVRYVHKPQGSKPGMVIYEKQRTVYVTPDTKTVEALKTK